MLTYRQTKDKVWVVFGPAVELPEPGTYRVHKKDGSTQVDHVVRVSRPFDVNGVPHVYGFKAAPLRGRGGCQCRESDCCAPCYCTKECACKGGPIYDCMG